MVGGVGSWAGCHETSWEARGDGSGVWGSTLVTGEALADDGMGSARTSGAMSDEGEATRTAEEGVEMGEGAIGRPLPLAFFSLARLF